MRLNLVASLRISSTLLIYSDLSKITVPRPLSGRVMTTDLSARKDFNAVKRALGKVGRENLCLGNFLKES